MFDHEANLTNDPTRKTYIATIQVEVQATSQMEAGQKLQLMAVTSAVPIRSLITQEFRLL